MPVQIIPIQVLAALQGNLPKKPALQNRPSIRRWTLRKGRDAETHLRITPEGDKQLAR